MEELTNQFQDHLSLATESQPYVRQELERRIDILRQYKVLFNNETLVKMEVQLATLHEREGSHEAARSLFESVATTIIRAGITPQWDSTLPRYQIFVERDLGYIDLDDLDLTPEECEQKRVKLVERQRQMINEHDGAPEKGLQFLKLWFDLAEFCSEGSPSDKEEAYSIHKYICNVALTREVPDPRREDTPRRRLEDASWFPKQSLDSSASGL